MRISVYIAAFASIAYSAALPQDIGEELKTCGDQDYYPSKVSP